MFCYGKAGFALGSALAALRWLNEGWGYEVSSVDVIDAYNLAVEAAGRLRGDDVSDEIRCILDQTQAAGNAFVRQSLSKRTRQLNPRAKSQEIKK